MSAEICDTPGNCGPGSGRVKVSGKFGGSAKYFAGFGKIINKDKDPLFREGMNVKTKKHLKLTIFSDAYVCSFSFFTTVCYVHNLPTL